MVAAQPASVPTGDLGWIRIFAVTQAAAFGLYGVTLLLIRRAAPRMAAVVVLAAVIQLLPLLAPLMLSSDVWGYWNAGRIAVVDGGNPYVDTPATYPDDPSLPFTRGVWRDQTTAYGPAFTVGSEAVAAVVGEDAATAAWLYKAAAGLLMVALTMLVSLVAPRPAFAAAFVGWNPVFAMQFAGSGHNDVLMITLVVAGILLGLRGRATGAGTAWSIGVFVRWLPIILLCHSSCWKTGRDIAARILPGFVHRSRSSWRPSPRCSSESAGSGRSRLPSRTRRAKAHEPRHLASAPDRSCRRGARHPHHLSPCSGSPYLFPAPTGMARSRRVVVSQWVCSCLPARTCGHGTSSARPRCQQPRTMYLVCGSHLPCAPIPASFYLGDVGTVVGPYSDAVDPGALARLPAGPLRCRDRPPQG